MVKHLNVVVRDSELQEFIDRIDGSEWNLVDIEARKQFNFIIQKVLEWNIILEYEICSFNDIKIQDFDLCTVVSNMLDNGIEAAEKTAERYVKFQINRKSGRLLIILRNSSPDVDGNLDTTKEDINFHGIGIKQIKSVTAKYDGDCVFRYENGEFISVINMVCE